MFFPQTEPKEPTFKWTQLREAAAIILEQEVKLEPEAFLEWLQERPGAALIYSVLAQGDRLTDQIVRELQTMAMPEGELPVTLSELIDERGHISGWRDAPSRLNGGGPSVAQHQWRTMSGLRYAAEHPKGR